MYHLTFSQMQRLVASTYKPFLTAEDFPAVVVNRHSKVWACEHLHPIYIGRGTIYGNPFRGDRVKSIEQYRQYAPRNEELMRRLPELRGRIISCSCKPRDCHGDVLVELLKTYTDHQLRTWRCTDE